MSTYRIQRFKCRLVRDGRAQPLPLDRVECTQDAARVLRVIMRPEELPHEELHAIWLNGRNRIIGHGRISQGGVHGAAVTPADVLRPAIVASASAYILCHNHPSGDPTPSADDMTLTRAIVAASAVVGVTFLDHLVIAAHGYQSIRDLLGGEL